MISKAIVPAKSLECMFGSLFPIPLNGDIPGSVLLVVANVVIFEYEPRAIFGSFAHVSVKHVKSFAALILRMYRRLQQAQ